MHFMTILIETVILMILFTVAVLAGSRNPVDTVYDMPEPIVNRCLELGLIDETKKASSPQTKMKIHFIGSLKGMVIGLPVCLLVGLLVQIVNWVIS